MAVTLIDRDSIDAPLIEPRPMDTEDFRNMRAPKIEIIGATTLGGNSGKSTSKSILKKGDSTMNTKKRLAFWDDNYNSSP